MNYIKGLLTSLLLVAALLMPLSPMAQIGIGSNPSYDIDYLTPKQYEIGGIEFENAENFDSRMILLIAGLQVGDKISIPGDKISTAIDNLWKQGMFEDVRITVTRLQGNVAFLKIILKERPKLNVFSFSGINKGDDKKLREEIRITSGDVVTENMLQTSANIIRSFYIERGFTNCEVTPRMDILPDSNDKGYRANVAFVVKRGKRVKIENLVIEGNKEIPTNKLLRKMKNTHDVHYSKKMYFWTKQFWTKSKFYESSFNEDLNSIITYYNEEGYRDARITFDTVIHIPADKLDISSKKKSKEDRLQVVVRIHEGEKFYFRNIHFTGNTVYTEEQLANNLRIEKGMPYNQTQLEQNLRYNPAGTDITSMYMDNGYLFFNCTPVETAVENDSIDIEVRIVEGKQARIRNVSVEGNTITNDKVIYRELHTRPGDLFSREDLLRSQRELITLGYFKQETLVPEPKPNAADGTVDIVYHVEENHTSQVNLSGGYGGGIFIIQAGLQLNNFSAKRMFERGAWKPFPGGDGQKLGFNISSNFASYGGGSITFTEPWLGGKRPQSFSAALYMNMQSNGYYYEKSDPLYSSLQTMGAQVSLTRRLKWPDDYFILSQSLNYKNYNVDDSVGRFNLAVAEGSANDISYSLSLTRNSYDSPIFTRSGSEISLSATTTLPYSLFNGKDYTTMNDQDKYHWIEYYKINLKGSWMFNLIGDVVLNAKFRMGFMGYFNKDIGLSPFGRYYVGGDGLTSYYYDGREVIPLRGYDNNAISPATGAGVFDRFTLELRQPIIESAMSTIWVLGFLEGGNAWNEIKEFQPFDMYNSAGLGIRVYMPAMLGLIGVDWGYGFDGANGGSHFHFTIGGSID